MLRRLVLPAVLVMGINAGADDSALQGEWNSKGLIGVEVGYMGTAYRTDTGNSDINDDPIIDDDTASNVSLGLKFGAETKFYRAFLEGRIWNSDDYNRASTLGGALQYLIPVGKMVNIFLGINGGAINSIDAEWDPYFGGDAGVNVNFSEDYGLEIGGRYSDVDVKSTDYGKVDSFYQLYVTAIFKFSGEY